MTSYDTHGSRRFDTIDSEIIRLLAGDGRSTNRAIAEQLNISPRQVASRIDRLTSNDLLKFVALLDMRTAGYELILSIGLKTAGRCSRKIAEELAAIDEVISLLLMTGEYNIEMLVLAEDHRGLERFVNGKLFRISGIQSVTVAVAVQIKKFKFSWAPFVSSMESDLAISPRGRFDEINRKIVQLLWQDATMSFQAIADQLDNSESNVRNRVMRMKADGSLQIVGVTNMELHDTDVLAFVELKIDGSQSERLLEDLAKIRNVVFISVMLGRCDILVMVLAKTPKQLAHWIVDTLEKMPGVLRINTSQRMESIKHDPRWVHIISQETG